MPLAPDTQLGPYQILAPLGAGGMGEVYRARDARLGREVAVKVLPESLAKDSVALTRFEREARALAALSHPHILTIHDIGTEETVTYLVTELLEGETLRARLGGAALPWPKAVEIGLAVAEGLGAAHAKGIIHRDLKPDNLFLTAAGGVKILDFGLARVEQTTVTEEQTAPRPESLLSTITSPPMETRLGSVVGTVGYMAPEQVLGERTDARSDLFALGCVLYEMLAGKRPFSGTTVTAVMQAILHDQPPDLGATGKRTPPDLQRIIARCLEKKPDDRFQSARDLAFALKTALAGSDITAPTAEPFRKPAARGKRKAIGSIAVLPLGNASGDAQMEYLSDGITESLINLLSRLPKLRVMARSTVFRYKGRDVDPQEVGRELKVRAVLTGRVLQRGNRLVIKAELVDVADGAQLWGEQYNRDLADILAVEEAISKEIADNLRLRLTGEQKKRLAQRSTANCDAYRLYLQGRFYWNKRTEEGIRKAIEHFREALDQDATYAQAYAGLADCYALLPNYAGEPPKEFIPKAEAAAEQALMLDDTLAEAQASLGMIRYSYAWDWSGAEQAFQRAIELNPSYATGHHWYAYFLMVAGRAAEALSRTQDALKLDPLSLIINANVGFCLYFAREYDEAIADAQKTLALDANFAPTHYVLGLALEQKAKYEETIAHFQKAMALSGEAAGCDAAALGHAFAVSGQQAEAQKLLQALVERSRQRYVPPCHMALIALGLGEKEQALQWLAKACDERDFFLIYLKVDPRFDPLRGEPQFGELLKRIGLTD